MSKIQITVDDKLREAIKIQASEMGLSISSFSRYALKNFITPKLTPLEQAMIEDDEDISIEDFNKRIKSLKKNA